MLTSLPKVDVPTGDSIMDIYKSLAGGMAGTALWKMGDSLDTATDTAKALDKVKDAEKAGDALDAVGNMSKKTGDVADTVGDVSKRTDDLADTAGDAAKKADTAPAKSNGADDAVENVNDTAKPKETLEEPGKIEDNGGVEGDTNTGNPIIDNMQSRVPNNEVTPPDKRWND